MASTTFSSRDRRRRAKVYSFRRFEKMNVKVSKNTNTIAFLSEVADVTFTNSNEETYTFSESFVESPVVVLTVVDSENNDDANVNVFIKNIDVTGVTIGSSQFFTGKVSLHALEL